jgi:hypothetical protein
VRKETLAPSFRLRSHARTGGEARALRVERATGLDILWPSGGATDAIRDAGPSSLAAYEKMLPDPPVDAVPEGVPREGVAAPTVAIDQEDRPLAGLPRVGPEGEREGRRRRLLGHRAGRQALHPVTSAA